MRKRLRKMLTAMLVGSIIFIGGVGAYLQRPQFGQAPEGLRLGKIQKSINYADGQFHNQLPTPQIVGENRFSTMWKFLFAPKERPNPTDFIPAVKTDLSALGTEQAVAIWLGHSSYYLQIDGKRILIDPVFSPSAAPVSFANRAFAGTNLYTAEDMPEIDYLLISHDHWDHLDYPTIMALQPKIKHVICGLGVGAYFEQWGFAENRIHEADWYSALEMQPGFVIHVLPTRHFSGRLLSRNKTLWNSFAIVTPNRRVFYSGDGGYGPHIKQIGELLPGVDLAIMENGQYDRAWPYIHMMPEEVAQAAEELNAKALLPGHSGKFSIANHAWDDPFIRITAASQGKSYRLLTPIIGEPVELDNPQQAFSRWWEKIK